MAKPVQPDAPQHETQGAIVPRGAAGSIALPREVFNALVRQAGGQGLTDSGVSSPYFKYAFEFFKLGAELMNIFSNLHPQPFSSATVKVAPSFPGFYLVLRADTLVYVGVSDNLRRRLHEHVRGKSTFALAAKTRHKPNDWKKFLAATFMLHCQQHDDLQYLCQLEHVIIGVFKPPFNRE